ncbi:hypothetical protein ACIA8C_09930 [Nocardia sp. NPDC051321]|uniref:hypothetical protein n=1 Tax=Nocardia sp. NPDC051321 TaxID=3364323 RepID=UPI0037B6923D
MTDPSQPSASERMLDRLRGIQRLAAEETHIADLIAGYQDSGDPRVDQQRRAELDDTLVDLQHKRQLVEQQALKADVPQQVIDDVRTFGHSGHRPVPSPESPTGTPSRDSFEEFCLDMLEVERWDLERMVSLEVLRRELIASGRWSFGNNPLAVWKFAENTHRQYQRVAALAAGARITATEAAALWGGASAENIRGLHAGTAEDLDEMSVVAEWSTYANASPKPPRPPYVSDDLDVTAVLAEAGASPPTPQQMFDIATTALRADYLDATADHRIGAAPTAMTTAVQQALVDNSPTWGSERDEGTYRPETSDQDLGLDT